MKFLLDTGATVSMIGLLGYEELKKPKCQLANSTLKAYGGTSIELIGKLDVEVEFNNQFQKLPLLVANSQDGVNVFGMDWFEAFDLQVQNVVYTLGSEKTLHDQAEKSYLDEKIAGMCRSYESIFEKKLGCASLFRAHLTLKENVSPKYFKHRPVPFSQMEAVQKEIERLVENGVLKSVKYSAWAAPIVVVPKPNSEVRLCGDFKVTVNPQLKIDQYPIPRAEELFHKLKNGKWFSKIDLAEAYLQIALDEESKQYMVINTHAGLYQFQRLPFGVASAPAIFQQFMDQFLAGLPNTASYLDDIVVSGQTAEEHLQTLEKLFKRLADAGLRCNLKKCEFLKSEIKYLGHVISKDGIRPTTEGIEAINKLPRPQNVKEVEAFLGKVNYYNKYIKNFSQVAAPLNELRRKDVKFVWTNEREQAFREIKRILVGETMLVHFQSDLPIILATDASSFGVGAVISHKFPNGDEKPIAFASKTLNEHQRKYSQIEKEALSIIFGVTKFHQYLYGRRFELVTDHKPLVTLFHPEKKLPVMTVQRLQRWAITLMSYNYTIRFRPTAQHGNADALSRLPMGSDVKFDEMVTSIDIEEEYDKQLDDFPINFAIIEKYNKQDDEMKQIRKYIEEGWPEFLPKDQQSLSKYFARRTSLTCHKSTILLQTEHIRVVIPAALRKSVLKLLHEGHWGIVRTKQLARNHCWWPSMEKDIEQLIRECTTCQEVSPSPHQEFSCWPASTKPWERVHFDFAGPFLGNMYLLGIDAYSKYPFVIKMGSIAGQYTIRAIQGIFASEGLPELIVTDNGPSFVGEEFQDKNGIIHKTTAAFHPASNGEAERFVRTFKTAMKKYILDGNSTDDALLRFLASYRFTPGLNGKSPAELLHGRQPKTILSLIQPSEDRPARIRSSKFKVDDLVFVRNFGKGSRWWHGKIIQNIGRVMYKVEVGDKIIRRHQNQLRPRTFAVSNEEMADILSKTVVPESQKESQPPSEPLIQRNEILKPSPPVIISTPRRSERIRKPKVRFEIEG